MDDGELPDFLSEKELAPRVLTDCLGVYLRNELRVDMRDLYWEHKQTQAFIRFLCATREDQLEDLSFGNLEGSQVSNLWLKTLADLTPAQ